jgi:uncharacterized heparinase superfamily protein
MAVSLPGRSHLRHGRTAAAPAARGGSAFAMSHAVATRVRVGWLVTRSARQAAMGALYASILWRWRFGRGEPERLVLAPQDLRAADPTRAAEIIEGRFTFAGKTVDCRDVSPFLVAAPSPAWREALLSFSWLRHLRAAGNEPGRAAARRLVGDFIRSQIRFEADALDPLITARRVLTLLSQAPLALDGADRGFYRAFIRSLNWQMNYLLRAGGVGRDGLPRLICAVAACQASLCLSEKGAVRRRATRWLGLELQRQILPDGGHVSRNPQAIIDLLLDLLPLRQSFAARNVVPPPEVMGAIDRMMPMLRFFRHADGAFATFNGMGYTQSHLIATLLAYDDARGRPVQNAPHSGYQRIDGAGAALIVDAGPPPPMAVAQEAHAGALAFEFSADNARIFVNCGAPGSGRPSLRQAARITAAHNTATIGNRSSAQFVRTRGAERLIDRPIVGGPREVKVERREEGERVRLMLSHDGYRAAFGALHSRVLEFDRATGALYGSDSILTPSGAPWAGAAEVVLRFHLHPAVTIDGAEGSAEMRLTLANGKVWRFRAEGAALHVEESVHFANAAGPRRAAQIVLTCPTGAGARPVEWSLAPRGAGPAPPAVAGDLHPTSDRREP